MKRFLVKTGLLNAVIVIENSFESHMQRNTKEPIQGKCPFPAMIVGKDSDTLKMQKHINVKLNLKRNLTKKHPNVTRVQWKTQKINRSLVALA